MPAQRLPMEEPRIKLANLQEFMLHVPIPLVYDFGNFLASYITAPTITPEEFLLICENAFEDLKGGINRHTNTPIRHKLVGYPPMTWGLLRTELSYIADAIFPSWFASNVAEHVQKIQDLRK